MRNGKLGVNATLAERIEHDPESIDFDELVDDLDELKSWRELCNAFEYGPEDVSERIRDYERQIDDQGEEIEELHAEISELRTTIEALEDELATCDEGRL